MVRRGSRPGVDWTTVETYMAGSRVALVDESLRRDTRRLVRGVPLLARVGSGSAGPTASSPLPWA